VEITNRLLALRLVTKLTNSGIGSKPLLKIFKINSRRAVIGVAGMALIGKSLLAAFGSMMSECLGEELCGKGVDNSANALSSPLVPESKALLGCYDLPKN